MKERVEYRVSSFFMLPFKHVLYLGSCFSGSFQQLKGQLRVFEVGLYEVFVRSRCLPTVDDTRRPCVCYSIIVFSQLYVVIKHPSIIYL